MVQDIFFTETAKFADVVLPAATFPESEGTFVNMEGRLQKFGPAIVPLGEAKPGWRIIRDLAGTMGIPGFEYESAAAVYEALAKAVPAFRGLEGADPAAEAFVREPGQDGLAFAVKPVSAEPAALPFTEHDPDRYKGLSMSREIKGLHIVRGRK